MHAWIEITSNPVLCRYTFPEIAGLCIKRIDFVNLLIFVRSCFTHQWELGWCPAMSTRNTWNMPYMRKFSMLLFIWYSCTWISTSICRGLFCFQWCQVRVGIPLTGINPPHFCACHKPESGFPSANFVVFLFVCLSSMIWGVTVDHHFLNFLFVIQLHSPVNSVDTV